MSSDINAPTGRMRQRLPELMILVAFVVYLLCWLGPPSACPDTTTYQDAAQRLSRGDIRSVFHRSIGYPIILILTRSAETLNTGLFILQLCLSVGTAWLTLNIVRRLAFRLWTAVLVTALLLSPSMVGWSAYALTESTTTFLLVLTLWWLVRDRHTFTSGLAAGLALGFAAWVRPTYQLVGLLVAVLPFKWGTPRSRTGLLLGSMGPVLGLCSWYYHNTGYFGLNAAMGLNLCTKTVRIIDRLPPGPVRDVLVFHRNKALVRSEPYTEYMYIWSAVEDLETLSGLPRRQLERRMLRLNLSLIVSNPLQYMVEVGHSAVSYVFPALPGIAMRGSRLVQGVYTVVHFMTVAVFFLQVMVVTGLWLTGRRLRLTESQLAVYRICAAVAVYSAIVSCLAEVGNPRYRVPTDPLLLLMVCIGVCAWFRERVSDPRREREPAP